VRTAQAANTFGGLVQQYLEFKQSRLRSRSLVEVRRHLEITPNRCTSCVVSVDKVIAHLVKDIGKKQGHCQRQPDARKPVGAVGVGHEGNGLH